MSIFFFLLFFFLGIYISFKGKYYCVILPLKCPDKQDVLGFQINKDDKNIFVHALARQLYMYSVEHRIYEISCDKTTFTN